MAVLEVRKAGDSVLKRVAVPIKKVDGKIRALLDDMADTMYKSEGIGLAAPQVGASVRAVVMDVGDGRLLEMINPEITSREGTVIDSEGCLSVPGMFGDVERSAKVTVAYTTRYGKRRTLDAENILARCVQHEIDHLDGVLFIDVAKSLRQESTEE